MTKGILPVLLSLIPKFMVESFSLGEDAKRAVIYYGLFYIILASLGTLYGSYLENSTAGNRAFSRLKLIDELFKKIVHADYNYIISDKFWKKFDAGLHSISGDMRGYQGVLKNFITPGGEVLTLGSFYLYSTTLANFNTNFFETVKSFSEITTCANMLESLYEYMNLEEEEDRKKESLETIEVIEFKDLSFKYPNLEDFVLKNINFKIHRGEKISIVGLNGAGKTTIIKLLCGFYPPTKGKITINGKDLQDYKKKDLQKNISAVFQDYHLFNFSIGENIGSTKDFNREKVKKIVEDLNLEKREEHSPEGIDSIISTGYLKGEKFYGGEEQKIAIGRALYKNADLAILDEPTSALDPESEAEIYENFSQLVEDKTSIFISHQMSSSVFCDKIVLLNNAEIEVFDSHVNLMKNKESLYYKLFTTQQENYLLKKQEEIL